MCQVAQLWGGRAGIGTQRSHTSETGRTSFLVSTQQLGPEHRVFPAAGGGRGVNHRQAEWAEPGDGGWSSGLLDLGVWSCLAVWGADAER